MKKLVSLMIAALLLFSLSLPAFADLDEGDFGDWYVICGMGGYSFEDTPWLDQEDEDMHDTLEPGTRLHVHSFDSSSKKYLLVIDDRGTHEIKGHGFVYVTEEQLNKYFVGEKKTISKETGTKLKEAVNCVVTPKVGVVLRQGPATTFPAYKTIPQNARITYQYVTKYSGRNWGHTTYKGTNGWCCIDYTEKIVETTVSTTEEPTETTAKATTEPSTKAATTTTAAPEATTEATEPTSFFGNTNAVIIICCMGAVILALTAVVFLLIVKRKRNDFENGQ